MTDSSDKSDIALHSGNAKDPINYGVLDNSIGYLLRRAQIKVFQEFNHFFDALDMKPAQFSALEVIHHNPGLRQSALANALNIQRTNMVGMLDILQERGLVDRKPSPNDRRSHALHLTTKGEKLLKHLHMQFHTHEDRLMGIIGEGNREILRGALINIANAPRLEE